MGKEGDLWDDSALIKAFDSALSKYKVMHGVSHSPEAKIATTSVVPDNGSNENVQVNDNGDPVLASERNGENGNASQVLEKETAKLDFDAEHIVSSNIQGGSCPPNNSSVAAQSCPSQQQTVSLDLQNQNEFISNPNEQELYNLLWSKYYELENQRQDIIQQLNQYGNWNYQPHDSSTFPSEEHQGSVPQSYDTVNCSCSYGCQNWIVPSNSMPACCSGGTCTDTSKGAPGGTSVSEEDPIIVKTAMAAAERALSSLMKKDIHSDGTSANGGNGKEVGVQTGADSTNSTTDLAVVLNAWYSAGFYTGKYLSEQSFENKKHQ